MNKTVPSFSIFNKQRIGILLFLLSLNSFYAQVKIGDNPQNIDPTSLLELESTDKVMVLSRITTAQMQVITPLQGAVIYNIEEQCIFYYNGSDWINLCSDANGFSILDNGDNTYTVNYGTNPEFTFSTSTETITNIEQNADGTYTYTNEAGEQTLIATSTTGTSTFSITDNGDNTYTFNDGAIPAFTLSANPETVTNIVQNPNGTFSYTNEAGEEIVIANGSGTGTSSLSITDNGDNTYTVNDGTNPAFIITATPETVTNIAQNPNGTFTYTNEAGEETVIANGSGTGTSSLSITDNGDNTYTVNDGTNPEFTIIATPETVTNITQNQDGKYTYKNEAGDETVIASNALSITDNGDNTYTVNDGTNPEFTITASPETITRIVQNADGTYTYTNEAGDETIIASSSLSITDNGDDTFTVNDGTNPEFTISAQPETITSITENTNGTYTYTNEADDEIVISFSGSSEEGSVFFADDANGFAENNAKFFWDNTTERLGLGTNTALTDKLTVEGTIGTSPGSVSEPSYRFSNDNDTGMYNGQPNELNFSAGGVEGLRFDNESMYVNNALPTPQFVEMPLLIRANETELMGFQYASGQIAWHLNLRAPTASTKGGLNFAESGVTDNRLFLENGGSVGINTNSPIQTLHVVGDIRVTDLPPSEPNDNIVTVDQFGRFHKSTNPVTSKSSLNSVFNHTGRWMNALANISLNNGHAILPIFDIEDFKDGGLNFYEVYENGLNIKTTGRYEIRATVALLGNLKSNGEPANTYARITVNNIERGAISVAGSNGSTDSNALSSIHISDVLELRTGDKITITLHSEASSNTLRFAGSETSNFTIIKQ